MSLAPRLLPFVPSVYFCFVCIAMASAWAKQRGIAHFARSWPSVARTGYCFRKRRNQVKVDTGDVAVLLLRLASVPSHDEVTAIRFLTNLAQPSHSVGELAFSALSAQVMGLQSSLAAVGATVKHHETAIIALEEDLAANTVVVPDVPLHVHTVDDDNVALQEQMRLITSRLDALCSIADGQAEARKEVEAALVVDALMSEPTDIDALAADGVLSQAGGLDHGAVGPQRPQSLLRISCGSCIPRWLPQVASCRLPSWLMPIRSALGTSLP